MHGGGHGLPVLIGQKSVMRTQAPGRLHPPANLCTYSNVIMRTKYALPNKVVGKKIEGRGQLYQHTVTQVHVLNRNPSSYQLCYETESKMARK